eukprot:m.39874 g.39874  ORF g.39874 m.39874 type:complete len:154 (+) comp32857_c0_seq2:25-486(+)
MYFMAAHIAHSGPSPLQCYVIRLKPGEDIVSSLQQFVAEKKLNAAFILTCVGSVSCAKIRLASATAEARNEVIDVEGCHEIVSLVGTLNDGGHLHVSLSDAQGKVIGGHAMGNMKVFTTAEIAIGNCSSLQFKRAMDPSTGFFELEVAPNTLL